MLHFIHRNKLRNYEMLEAQVQPTVAQIILQQLGSGLFAVMTGAKDFTNTGNGLSFRLNGRMTKQSINYVKIELNGSDLYDVSFGRIRSSVYKDLETLTDVYAEDLVRLFEETTGLFTHF